jgi:site-specific DNA-methyltransferase (adenine-specific)
MSKNQSPMRVAFKSYDKLLPLSSLKPNKFQRNKHPKEQIERLAKIMREHGVRHPIHISTRSKQVCFGHGRWEAAELNGWDKYPVVYQDFKSAKEEFACVQSDNAIASWAELDQDTLKSDLLDFKDLDIELLGIKDFSISETLEGKCDKDEIPERAPAVCKLGDIWQLGDHRLMCGDSTSLESVEKLMNGEKADLWLTDPPYGVGMEAREKSSSSWVNKKRINKQITNDDKPISEMKTFWTNCATAAFGACSEKAAYYWFACQGGDQMMMMMMSLGEGGWQVKHELMWLKDQMVFGRADYHYKHEPILYGWKRKCSHEWHGDRKQTSVLECKRPRSSELHPTMKPIELLEPLLANSTKPEQGVLDLFGGSGSTLIACEKTNRRCFMMEIDPHYCDVIIARFEKYTGKKAKRIEEKERAKAKTKIHKAAHAKSL